MARQVSDGFLRRAFPGLSDLGPESVAYVSLHAGPVSAATMREADGAPPPRVAFVDEATVTHTFTLLSEAVRTMSGSLYQVTGEFHRLAESAQSYGADEWPDAEDDHYDGAHVGYDHEGTGRGDPLATVHGLSYDQTLAEIDARLRGE